MKSTLKARVHEIRMLRAYPGKAQELRLEQARVCVFGMKARPVQKSVRVGGLEKDSDVQREFRRKQRALKGSGV